MQWEARQPVSLPYRVYIRPHDKKLVCVMYLPKGKYVVREAGTFFDRDNRLTDSWNPYTWSTTWLITVGDDPSPGPVPDPVDPRPDLSGFPGDVQREIRNANIPAELATKLSAAYATVAAKCFPRTMPDGNVIPAYASDRDAKTAIEEAVGVLPRSMTGFNSWLIIVINRTLKAEPTQEGRVEALGKIFQDVAKGIGAM